MYPSSRILNDGRGLDIAEQSELDELSAEIAAVRSSKQNTLTAGDNIDITNQIISAVGSSTLQAAYDGGNGRIQLAATPLTIISGTEANSLVISNSAQNKSLVVSGCDLETPGRIKAGWMTLGGINLQDKLNDKQDSIHANNMTIAFTYGLQEALNSKQPIITEADTLRPHSIDLTGTYTIEISGSDIISIAPLHLQSSEIHLDTNTVYYRNSTEVDTVLNTTLDTLRTDIDAKLSLDGDLTIAQTNGLQSALNAKQSTINNGD